MTQLASNQSVVPLHVRFIFVVSML